MITGEASVFAFIGAFAGVMAALAVRHLWRSRLRALFARDHEARKIAQALLVAHGERAAEIALSEEDRAWRGPGNRDTEMWNRVFAELQRHYEAQR